MGRCTGCYPGGALSWPFMGLLDTSDCKSGAHSKVGKTGQQEADRMAFERTGRKVLDAVARQCHCQGPHEEILGQRRFGCLPDKAMPSNLIKRAFQQGKFGNVPDTQVREFNLKEAAGEAPRRHGR